jgi:hypothetical protein
MVLLVAVVVLIPKIVIAARTYGTNDISHWHDFLIAVADHGPVGIYSVQFDHSFYNHPPLIGYYLWLINQLQSYGLTMRFTIRAVSSIADVASSLLIFEILRRRRSLLEATASGLLIAASPVLFMISGFHGNTDPIFTMFILLSVHLLADRSRPTLAGVAIGLAVGVKIVPVVVIPALLIFALIKGRGVLARFMAGFVATFLITWGQALLEQREAVQRDVLGYAGSGTPQWGLVQLGHWAADPGWVHFLETSGRFLIVVLCAVLPAVLVWLRPHLLAEAVGLSLCLFLFLSPAFGAQYLVWALAGTYLLNVGWGTAYNVSGGIFLAAVYTRWNDGFPWNVAKATPFLPGEIVGGFVVWQILGLTCYSGLVRIWKTTAPTPGNGGVTSQPVSAVL